MIALIAGRLFGGTPEISSANKGDIAFEFCVASCGGLRLHQRKCARILLARSSHASFRNDEREIGRAKIISDVMDEINHVGFVFGVECFVDSIVPALMPAKASQHIVAKSVLDMLSSRAAPQAGPNLDQPRAIGFAVNVPRAGEERDSGAT